MFPPKPNSAPADYIIKAKGPDGKNKPVGRGWNKTSQYGQFISLSIGDASNRHSYIMVKSESKPAERPKPSGLEEGQWRSLEEAIKLGPTGPKEGGPSEIPDDDLGI